MLLQNYMVNDKSKSNELFLQHFSSLFPDMIQKNWVYSSDDQASIYQNWKFHEPSARDLFCLFVCLGFFVPLEIFSLIWRRQHDRRRAGSFDLFTFTTKVFCGWDSNTPPSACRRTLYPTAPPLRPTRVCVLCVVI